MQYQAIGFATLFMASHVLAQAPAVASPEVAADRHIAFHILAPKAQQVRLFSTDIFGVTRQGDMTKADSGVWEITIGPIDPGAYRYNFNVDGVSVMDPRNPSVSESNGNAWSMVYVPGADFMETKDVPHGAVASVTYFSKSLNRFRRMHIYTPPGYDTGSQKYPIFYLLHGAGDSDDSWTSVGRAGFIIDNLIADKKAKPMVIVMPAGHTGPFDFSRPPSGAPRTLDFNDDFVKDFVSDIMPYAETHYRVERDRQHRAIAGLSMGGAHTLNIAIPHANEFAYVGVYSSGIFGIVGAPTGDPPAGPSWEQQHLADLDNSAAKKGLKLFWFATGKEDGLLSTSKATVELFKKHGFQPEFHESAGAHTWTNWREYLNQFAPQLFQ
ncbi:MAG TPA: alpha/beta fold hydrolase [Bryobacteraceae bacterium]|jgi:enterochelin esterase-like enzyme|nr:alpha/beta fold hydrolase [Bryobacteraceae bacterium]